MRQVIQLPEGCLLPQGYSVVFDLDAKGVRWTLGGLDNGETSGSVWIARRGAWDHSAKRGVSADAHL